MLGIEPLTIHMIANSHLDPVWLWRRSAGVDEALNTSRTVCNLLDEYPTFIFTRGEAWLHAMIERHDPALFERVRSHVAAGRWCVVNGWWIQSDCNFPTKESFQKQAEIGKGYFQSRFGIDVTVGYNVDSFGHSAYLPAILRQSGMKYYVFMRPQAHEKSLPSNLFRWQAPSGESVVTARLGRSYATHGVADLEANVEDAIENANPGAGHAMCFYGIGDHGGAVGRDQIEWIHSHAEYRRDVRLEFSSPQAFFAHVESAALPVVEDELQYHAIGAYTAGRRFRRRLRRSEQRAIEAEAVSSEPLDEAWTRILFNQFHDIAGGCAIKSAYEDATEEIGAAATTCTEELERHVRRIASGLPPDRLQRLVLFNPARSEVRGAIPIEPWLGYPGDAGASPSSIGFLDEDGRVVPSQPIAQEAAARLTNRFLVETAVPPGAARVLRIVPPEQPTDGATAADGAARADASTDGRGPGTARPAVTTSLDNGPVSVSLTGSGASLLSCAADGTASIADLRFDVMEDSSDTWSHGRASYDVERLGAFAIAEPWRGVEDGPLRFAAATTVRTDAPGCEGSRVELRVALVREERVLRVNARVYWHATHRVLKLVIVPAFPVSKRIDLVPGGPLERRRDGNEYPIQDAVSIYGEGGITCVTADAYAADVQGDGTIRITLLRSPYFAHHRPAEASGLLGHPVMDQGLHELEFALHLAGEERREELDSIIAAAHAPIVTAQTTRGM